MRKEWIAAGLLMVGGCAWAQNQPTPQHPIDNKPEGQGRQCSYTVTDSSGEKVTGTSNCAPQQPANTPAAQKFPYPGEDGALDTPAKKPADAGDDNAAKKFPYPGDDAGGLKDAGSSGDSSSSSSSGTTPADAGSSSSSSANALPPSPDDVNSDTPPAPKRGMHKKPEPPPKDVAQQEAEDLQVAGFYMNDKNYRGAYGRAQDAVRLASDDADAHLALAEAARKLGKLDEAEREYRQVLTMDPVPKTRKVAERALNEMTGGQ